MTPQEAAEQHADRSVGNYRYCSDHRGLKWEIVKCHFLSGQQWQHAQDYQALSSALKEIAEEDTKHAHAGCWLQGEMVGYARCMVKWLESAPKKEEESEEVIWEDLLCNVIGDPYDDMHSNELKRKIAIIKERFEIKRKPL